MSEDQRGYNEETDLEVEYGLTMLHPPTRYITAQLHPCT